MSFQLFIGKADATPGDPSGWTDVGHLTDGISLRDDTPGADEPFEPIKSLRASTTSTMTFKGLNSETWAALVGTLPPPPKPQSVVVEYTDWASGAPYVAPLRTGWRYWFDKATGRRAHYERLRQIKRRHWVAAGCPKKPVTVRLIIPRATLTPTTEPLTFSDHGDDRDDLRWHAEQRIALSVMPPTPSASWFTGVLP